MSSQCNCPPYSPEGTCDSCQQDSKIFKLETRVKVLAEFIQRAGHLDCARDMDWHTGPECDLPNAKHLRSKCTCGYEEALKAVLGQ